MEAIPLFQTYWLKDRITSILLGIISWKQSNMSFHFNHFYLIMPRAPSGLTACHLHPGARDLSSYVVLTLGVQYQGWQLTLEGSTLSTCGAKCVGRNPLKAIRLHPSGAVPEWTLPPSVVSSFSMGRPVGPKGMDGGLPTGVGCFARIGKGHQDSWKFLRRGRRNKISISLVKIYNVSTASSKSTEQMQDFIKSWCQRAWPWNPSSGPDKESK